jgi:transposase-like protein
LESSSQCAGRSAGKLTADRQKRIVEALRAGNYVSVAARFAGISPSTLFAWLRKGRAARAGRYREFHDAVAQALTFAEVRAVAILQKEMEGNWRAAAAYLARRFPRRWGPRENRPRASTEIRRPTIGSPATTHDESQLAQIGRVLAEAGALEARDPPASDPPDQ